MLVHPRYLFFLFSYFASSQGSFYHVLTFWIPYARHYQPWLVCEIKQSKNIQAAAYNSAGTTSDFLDRRTTTSEVKRGKNLTNDYLIISDLLGKTIKLRGNRGNQKLNLRRICQGRRFYSSKNKKLGMSIIYFITHVKNKTLFSSILPSHQLNAFFMGGLRKFYGLWAS